MGASGLVFALLLPPLTIFTWAVSVPPAQRAQLLQDAPAKARAWVFHKYFQELVPSAPVEVRQYLPTSLMVWLKGGRLAEEVAGDRLVGLYEAARDFNCVGGMLFP